METEGRGGYGAKHQHGYGQGQGHGGPFHRGQPGAAEQRATAGHAQHGEVGREPEDSERPWPDRIRHAEQGHGDHHGNEPA